MKRALALLLAVVMVLSMVSVSAFAAEKENIVTFHVNDETYTSEYFWHEKDGRFDFSYFYAQIPSEVEGFNWTDINGRTTYSKSRGNIILSTNKLKPVTDVYCKEDVALFVYNNEAGEKSFEEINTYRSILGNLDPNNGRKYVEAPIVSREGYKFLGWFDNEACTGERVDTASIFSWAIPGQRVIWDAKNITYYAKWESLARYTVTFESGKDGRILSGLSLKEKVEYTDLKTDTDVSKLVPSRLQMIGNEEYELVGILPILYLFDGWKDTDTGEKVTTWPTELTKNKTYVACWKGIQAPVVTTQAGYLIEVYTQQPDGTYTFAGLERSDDVYTLLTRQTLSSAKIDELRPGSHYPSINRDLSVLSGFVKLDLTKEKPTDVMLTLKVYYDLDQHTVTFKDDEGEVLTTRTLTCGNTLDLEDEELQFYGYFGWYLDEACTVPFDGRAITEDLTLYTPTDFDAPLFDLIVNEELPFRDVSFFDWNYDAVKFCYNNGLVNGVSYDLFAPKTFLTRGMVVTMLWRLEGQPVAPACKFADVKSNAYYYKAVNWAADCGIVVGVSEDKFAPDAYVTLEQLVTILARYAQLKGYAISGKGALPFADAGDVSDYAKEAVSFAYWKDMIHAYDGKLNAKGPATREQAVYAFYGLCK